MHASLLVPHRLGRLLHMDPPSPAQRVHLLRGLCSRLTMQEAPPDNLPQLTLAPLLPTPALDVPVASVSDAPGASVATASAAGSGVGAAAAVGTSSVRDTSSGVLLEHPTTALLDWVAANTAGYLAADLSAVVREAVAAASVASPGAQLCVSKQHFVDALGCILPSHRLSVVSAQVSYARACSRSSFRR